MGRLAEKKRGEEGKIKEVPSKEDSKLRGAQKRCRKNIKLFSNSAEHFHNCMEGGTGNSVREAGWHHLDLAGLGHMPAFGLGRADRETQ